MTRVLKFLVSFCLILLVAQVSYGQIFQYPNPGIWGIGTHRSANDSTLYYPTGCGVPSGTASLNSYGRFGGGQILKQSAFYYDSCGHKLWLYDPSSSTWSGFSSGVIDTTSISNRINNKVNISDTGNMLTPYAHKAQVVANLGGAPSFQEDVAANRPAPGNFGNMFLAVDTKLLYRDNGSGWDLIGSGGGGGSTDSSVYSTKAYRQKLADSLAILITLKLNITDSAGIYSTRARLAKTIDSMIIVNNARYLKPTDTFNIKLRLDTLGKPNAIYIRGHGQPGDTTIITAHDSVISPAAIRDSSATGQYVRHTVNPDSSWTFYNLPIAGGSGSTNITITRAVGYMLINSSSGTGDTIRIADSLHAGLMDTTMYWKLQQILSPKNDTCALCDSIVYAIGNNLIFKRIQLTSNDNTASLTNNSTQHKISYDIHVPAFTATAPGTVIPFGVADSTEFLGADNHFHIPPGIIKSSLFADSNARVYAGVIRPSSAAGHGQDITWKWLGVSDGHNKYGFTDYIDGSTGNGPNLYFPTATYIVTLVVSDDETLSGYGVTCGSSVQLDQALVNTWYPNMNGGGYLVGNGSSTLTANMTPGWTISYTPSTGSVFMNNSTAIPNYAPVQLQYSGYNNYHLARITSGLGIYNIGYQVLDAGGNPVTSNLTSSDIIDVTGQAGFTYMPMPASTSNATTDMVYQNTFANYWVICVVSTNPADPAPTALTATPSGTAGQNNLSWNTTTRATNYVVLRSTHPHYGYTSIYSGTATTFNDTGLTSGTAYYYRIQATAAGGTINNGWAIANAVAP